MTASVISMRKSYRGECLAWYSARLHLGEPVATSAAFVYSWHEEGEPSQCKIGYCTREPFAYLWDGTKLAHQKRLPVIFLTVGTRSVEEARALEGELHSAFEPYHLQRSCAREWFDVPMKMVCEMASKILASRGSKNAP